MKRGWILIFTVVFCALSLAACNGNPEEKGSDYIADGRHCVVALPQDYDIIYENDEIASSSKFDVDLYNAETVNGNPKREGYSYYNLLKNEPFRILTPLGIIQNKNADGQTLVYWKLNGTLYKDGDNYYSANVFTCNRDSEISPVYYGFRPVGMLLYEAGEEDVPFAAKDDIFDDEGNIKEQSGVHYLYGVYDFEPCQNFWRTDLTLNTFAIHKTSKAVAENYSKDFYTLNIEIARGNLFEKGKLMIATLYKIDGHGYMTYGVKQTVLGGTETFVHTLPLGGHEIKYSFT